MTITEDYTGESFAIGPERSIKASNAIETLSELTSASGVLAYIPSGDGPESMSSGVRERLAYVGVRNFRNRHALSWKNGYMASFSGKPLDRVIYFTIAAVKVFIARYKQMRRRMRPHRSLDYRPPEPDAILSARLLPAPIVLT